VTSVDALEITEVAALDALAPEWWDLFGRCPGASPFQSPEWLLPWRRAFLAQGPWTVAVRSAGVLVGIAAFFIYKRPEDGRRQLTLLGNGITGRLDMLAGTWARQRGGWGRLRLRRGAVCPVGLLRLPRPRGGLSASLLVHAARPRRCDHTGRSLSRGSLACRSG